MRLIFKHIFKDIMAHKLRTLLLMLCIIVCSFTAMLCFDLSGSLRTMLKGLFATVAGSSDLQIQTKSPVGEDFADGAPDCNILRMGGTTCYFDRRIDSDYSYVNRGQAMVMAVDPDEGRNMGVIRDDIVIGSKKVGIGKAFAEEFGFEVGDKIVLHGDRDIPVEFTVGSLEEKQGIFAMDDNTIVISIEDMGEMTLGGVAEITSVMVDVKDDSRIKDAENFFKEKYPTAEVTNFLEDKDLENSIKSISRVFLILFALCMLLVIFVTVSVSERMITDKMSVVGTFRSLGVSSAKTTFALIFENALFGLIGSCIGILLYVLVKEPLFNSMLVVDDALRPKVPMPKFYIYLGVVLGAVIIESLCPIKESIKALRVPIRDIIFNTKETEYKPSKVATIIGFVLLAAAAVCFFFKDSFAMNMICFVCIIAGAALLFNYVTRAVAKLLEKLFAKLNFPIAHLAAVEAGAKKSTVGSSVLCVTAAALALVIYMFSNSLSTVYSKEVFKCDVINGLTGTKPTMLSYIDQLEGVNQTEFFYLTSDYVNFDDKEEAIYVYGWKEGGNQLVDSFDGVDNNIGADEVCLGKIIMRKYGLEVGDKVKMTFLAQGYLPIEKELTIKSRINIDYGTGSGTSAVLNEDTYKEIYGDHPMYLFVKGDDPKAIKKTIQDHSADLVGMSMTSSEYMLQLTVQRASILMIIHALILIGVGLTFIGVVSNQLIGLEGRKRECAVMTSVAMPRKKLSKMFLLENMIAAGTALLFAIPIGMLMSVVFMRLMDITENVIPMTIPVVKSVFYAIFLWLIFTLVSLFPIRALKKMDVVSQLKYE
ncbi:ABC transporter permease [Ruminococcus flavefaciens]|uniref:ABC-type lipoprotein release transport system permease subunit n=1 Tax=Ruminococcus flavefaciens TaxID=1265 RepID=A0A315YT45_RUMFL|nr:FtsX-like permease family protein [Ruminococcus flavefaciens]PWJ15577.1 ABC-type lipoprotein release transport system permease subunit [Ruminococcus flavefaciens]SSA40818.1 ABC-type transport system, involved in lipoprotein release, permease component [Ruminococcus flavefaciens]